MSRPLRIEVQLWPGGAPDYRGYGPGATTFTTEIHPTDEGYDFSVLIEMLAWRDVQR